MEKILQNLYLTDYNSSALRDLWQDHDQIWFITTFPEAKKVHA